MIERLREKLSLKFLLGSIVVISFTVLFTFFVLFQSFNIYLFLHRPFWHDNRLGILRGFNREGSTFCSFDFRRDDTCSDCCFPLYQGFSSISE